VVPTEKKVPYLHFLASIATLLGNRKQVDALCDSKSKEEVIAFFAEKKN
jgi:mannitol/fructose-specific phosphotransferase system IIA component (Ntr-type)